uniref:Testis expressed 26 n=1 Tax=Mastacembelus armatus TaxID=205130 RepID=A0A3Q3M2M3_9TELE
MWPCDGLVTCPGCTPAFHPKRAGIEGKHWWDPYETSHRRQFVDHSNSAAEILLCPTSTSFMHSFLSPGPFGSTIYNTSFCWKPLCKPECIQTSFMMRRLPRNATQSLEYVRFPWKHHPSEEEIHKALTAQYHSTYRCDFVGVPQGRTGLWIQLAPMYGRCYVPFSDTEMTDNHRKPKQKPELLGNRSQYSFSAEPNMACCVPTVVQRHVQTQKKRSDLTTYDRFCGKTFTNAASVIQSLLPQELQQLHRILPEEGWYQVTPLNV